MVRREGNDMTVRIGMVNFINTAPLYFTWKKKVMRDDWLITEGPPTTLNRLLFTNELDLGFVSSQEYAVHPHLYKILPGISISATGSVGSVFLFSRNSPQDLDGKSVGLSGQSQTSVALVKIILEEFYQVKPSYVLLDALQGKNCLKLDAELAIGDEALRLRQAGKYRVCLDLSHEWQKQTGLPFVFALWAVRREFCRNHGELTAEIHRQLLDCIEEGAENLQSICQQAAPRIPMDTDACFRYLRGIQYDLGPEKIRALELFFQFLIRRGEVPAEALPLVMCGEDLL